jgi:hypothetical protein
MELDGGVGGRSDRRKAARMTGITHNISSTNIRSGIPEMLKLLSSSLLLPLLPLLLLLLLLLLLVDADDVSKLFLETSITGMSCPTALPMGLNRDPFSE